MKVKNCYRIVEDSFGGYEVQIHYWWLPGWHQKFKFGCINTFWSVEEAQEWIANGCPKDAPKKRKVYWNSCKDNLQTHNL